MRHLDDFPTAVAGLFTLLPNDQIVVAGGAVRDTLMNCADRIRDYDIYVKHTFWAEQYFRQLVADGVARNAQGDGNYQGSDVAAVFKVEDCDIILTRSNPVDHVKEHFPVASSECWATWEGGAWAIGCTEAFDVFRATDGEHNTINVRNVNIATPAYLQKLEEYFPGMVWALNTEEREPVPTPGQSPVSSLLSTLNGLRHSQIRVVPPVQPYEPDSLL